MMIVPMNVRKLAALDIVFHGPKLVIAEFAVGVCLPLGLAVLAFLRGRAAWQSILGAYMLFLAFNYLPLLIHAILIARKGSARKDVEAELANGKHALVRYQRQSFLLVIPLAVPLLAIAQLARATNKPVKG